MPKKILLIENDAALAAQVSASLDSRGFEVRVTGDGREGLELAREWAPTAIVLCVELPGMSGYVVCQKLRKDDELKSIPLVITSADATPDTFEKHRALKVRADEYVLKPYAPAALVNLLGGLVGLPEGAAAEVEEHEEELVSLEEEMGLEGLGAEPEADLPSLELPSLPDEAALDGSPVAADDDLRLLDDAFADLAAPPSPSDGALDLDLDSERPVSAADLDAAAASLPDEDEGAARADLGALDEADFALGALGEPDEALSPPEPPAPAQRPTIRGASADLLRAAGIKLLDDREASSSAIAPPPPSMADDARDAEIRQLESRLGAVGRRADDADAEATSLRARLDTVQAQLRKVEGELRSARDESRRAADQARAAEAKLSDAERRAEDAEAEARQRADEAAAATDALGKLDALERELDEARTEALVARGEADGARGEVERRTAELRKRVSDLEAMNAKNEERVLKAYQKIKADEKVRDKVRKALAIASQLLEEGAPPAEAEKRGVAAALLGSRE